MYTYEVHIFSFKTHLGTNYLYHQLLKYFLVIQLSLIFGCYFVNYLYKKTSFAEIQTLYFSSLLFSIFRTFKSLSIHSELFRIIFLGTIYNVTM